MGRFINISAYLFVDLKEEDLQNYRQALLEYAKECSLKGTILLSTEGINLFLSGTSQAIQAYKDFLNSYAEFQGLPYKDSPSEEQPFTRMLVRIKKEIIGMGHDTVKPAEHTAPYVTADTLKQAYDQDEDFVILDTRNDYEIALGKFENAIELNIKSFRDFPKAIESLPEHLKSKKIVTYCTGGIRCEKAAEYMLQKGFTDVTQLEGGILKYFETCGSDHYDGECFVFDKRVGVGSDLKETSTLQCFACRMPLTEEDQADFPVCPYCGGDASLGKRAREAQAQAQSTDHA